MIQCILNSRGFVASLLAGATGMALYFKVPFPAENVFLQLIALRTPVVYEGLFYSYSLFLFTTPYIGYSILLSALTREIRFLRNQESNMNSIPAQHIATGNRPEPRSTPSAFEPLLDSVEAARLLRIHPKTLQRMARQGQVVGIHVGKLWRFRASDIEAWVNFKVAV